MSPPRTSSGNEANSGQRPLLVSPRSRLSPAKHPFLLSLTLPFLRGGLPPPACSPCSSVQVELKWEEGSDQCILQPSVLSYENVGVPEACYLSSELARNQGPWRPAMRKREGMSGSCWMCQMIILGIPIYGEVIQTIASNMLDVMLRRSRKSLGWS